MQATTIHPANRGTVAPAAPETAGLPPAQWERITDNVLTHGSYRPPDHRIPGTMGLELLRGTPGGTRTANYVNLWGYKDSSGTFNPGYGSFVSEHWVLKADGNFHIDQWLHRIEMDGSHRRATHVTMVQTPHRRVLEYSSRNVRVDDPEAVRNLSELGALWTGFVPLANTNERTDSARAAAFMLNPRTRAPLHLAPPR